MVTKNKKNRKITILTGQNDWFNQYAPNLIKRLQNTKHHTGQHEVNLIHDIKDITEGDICFLLSVYEVVKPEVLKLNTINIVIHESELPKGKGWSPLYWQVLEGANKIPVCLFEAVEKVDAGEVYLRRNLYLEGHELVEEIREKQAKIRIDMALWFVDNYPTPFHTAQGLEGESFYRKRTAKDSELDINKSIEEQFNLLRIVDNNRYPAFFWREGVKYKITIEKDHSLESDPYDQIIDIKEGD